VGFGKYPDIRSNLINVPPQILATGSSFGTLKIPICELHTADSVAAMIRIGPRSKLDGLNPSS
jgi:hypothetical protein